MVEALDRRVSDADDVIARLQAAPLCRAARDHLRDGGRRERPDADVAQLLRPVEGVQHLDDLRLHGELELCAAALDRKRDGLAQTLEEGELEFLEPLDAAAVELDQPVARLEPGDGGRAAVAHGADLHRRVSLADDDEEDGEDRCREQQVRERTRERDGRTFPHRFGVE